MLVTPDPSRTPCPVTESAQWSAEIAGGTAPVHSHAGNTASTIQSHKGASRDKGIALLSSVTVDSFRTSRVRRQIYRQTDRKVVRGTSKLLGQADAQTGRQTERETDRQD